MRELLEGLIRAVELILAGDPKVIDITLRSIAISGFAIVLSILWSLPISVVIWLKDFRGKSVVKGVFNALIGVPTVALGLFLFLLFSKSGPLGAFQLLYIPLGVSVGQALLVTPIAVSLTVNALESTETQVMDLAKTLGASNIQASLEVLKEAMRGVLLALVASFNRAFAELGVAIMVGGNIKGVTRVLTTTIALETTRGEWVLSIALTIILLSIVITLSVLVNVLKRD